MSSARSASAPTNEWGTGLTSTMDNTLRRKSSVTAGDTNGADAFDPAVQWDGFAIDTFDGLGSHTVDGGPATDVAPSVTSTTPADGASNVAVDASPTVTFSEPVDAAAGAFTLSCSISGAKTLAVTGGPTTFTLDPSADFALGDACTLTVSAAAVTDQDAIDPPDSPRRRRRRALLGSCRQPLRGQRHPRSRAIQGSGDTAAITGTVTTRGVVVGDYEGPSPALRGFFIQDPQGDGDPATSDGIFVFEGSNADSVKLGDLVTVSGNAEREPGPDPGQRQQHHGLRHRHGRPDRGALPRRQRDGPRALRGHARDAPAGHVGDRALPARPLRPGHPLAGRPARAAHQRRRPGRRRCGAAGLEQPAQDHPRRHHPGPERRPDRLRSGRSAAHGVQHAARRRHRHRSHGCPQLHVGRQRGQRQRLPHPPGLPGSHGRLPADQPAADEPARRRW